VMPSTANTWLTTRPRGLPVEALDDHGAAAACPAVGTAILRPSSDQGADTSAIADGDCMRQLLAARGAIALARQRIRGARVK
jgi:hypothetical protein